MLLRSLTGGSKVVQVLEWVTGCFSVLILLVFMISWCNRLKRIL